MNSVNYPIISDTTINNPLYRKLLVQLVATVLFMTAEYDGRKSAKLLKVSCVLLYDKKKCKTNQDCNDLGCNIYFLFEILRKKGLNPK